jgi:hypothetical protein
MHPSTFQKTFPMTTVLSSFLEILHDATSYFHLFLGQDGGTSSHYES